MEGEKLMFKILKAWPSEPPAAADITSHFGDNSIITGLARNQLMAKLAERKVNAEEVLTLKGLDMNDHNVVILAHTALQVVKVRFHYGVYFVFIF